MRSIILKYLDYGCDINRGLIKSKITQKLRYKIE